MEQIKDLLSYLKLFSPRLVSTTSTPRFLKKIATIGRIPDFNQNTIYIGDFSQIKPLLRFHSSITFFVISDISPDPSEDYNNNCVLLFPQSVDMAELIVKCNEYFVAQNELHEYSHLLMNAYIDHGTPSSLIKCAYSIIGNPIMLIDTAYKVIYECGGEDCNDVLWVDSVQNKCCSYEFIALFNQISEIRNMEVNEAPFMAGCLQSPLRRCIRKIQSNGQVSGYLLAIELNTPFKESDFQVINQLARMIARMEVNSSQSESLLGTISNYFFAALQGNIPNKAVFHDFLKYSNIKLESNYYLLSVDISHYSVNNNPPTSLISLINNQLKYVISECYGTKVFFLVEYNNQIDQFTNELYKESELFKEMELTLAVSDQFNSLDDLNTYYKQTNYIHKTVNAMNIDKPIVSYNSLRLYDLIQSPVNLKNYNQFIIPAVEKIHQYDIDNSTFYLDTLYTYFTNNNSVQKTANVLFVHKNTVTYRINKAKELFEIDPTNISFILSFCIDYNILQLKQYDLLDTEDK